MRFEFDKTFYWSVRPSVFQSKKKRGQEQTKMFYENIYKFNQTSLS